MFCEIALIREERAVPPSAVEAEMVDVPEPRCVCVIFHHIFSSYRHPNLGHGHTLTQVSSSTPTPLFPTTPDFSINVSRTTPKKPLIPHFMPKRNGRKRVTQVVEPGSCVVHIDTHLW